MTKNNPISCYVFGLGSMLKLCTEQLLIHPGFDVLGFISADEDAIKWAQKQGLRTLQLADKVRYEQSARKLDSFLTCGEFDYFFSIVNAMKLPSHIIKLPKKMAINFHDSELPKYAGVDATSWAIMKQEPLHAVTWHSMSDEIDEGEIALQQCFPIDHDDTAFTLNGKCFEAGLLSFKALIEQIASGQLKTYRQDLTKRSYYSRYKPFTDPQLAWNHGIIDWQLPAEAIDALVRSLNFGPYRNSMTSAKVKCQDRYLMIERSAPTARPSSQVPGTVVGLGDNQLTVATATNDIVLSGLRYLDGRAMNVADTAAAMGLEPGFQLAMDTQNSRSIYGLDKRCLWNERFWAGKIRQARSSNLALGQAPAPAILKRYPIDCSDNAVSQLPEHQRPIQLLALFQVVIMTRTQSAKAVVWVRLPQTTQEFSDFPSLFLLYHPAILTNDHGGSLMQVAGNVESVLQEMSQKGGVFRDLLYRFPELRSEHGWFNYNEFGFSMSSGDDAVQLEGPFGIKLEVDVAGTQINLVIDMARHDHAVAEQWVDAFSHAVRQLGAWSSSDKSLHEMMQALNQPGHSPASAAGSASGMAVPEGTARQHIMTRIWCELLKVDAPDMGQNFFEFCDSIEAVIFICRINSETKLDLPLSIIYKHPTYEQWLEIVS